MLFKRCLLLLGLFFSAPVFSQHCGWDGVYMLCVKVTDSSGAPIDNLKLTLLDTLGNPMKNSKGFYERFRKYQQSDTLIFNQNLTEFDKSDSSYKVRPIKLAGKNYFVFFPFRNLPEPIYFSIKIEDTTKTYYDDYVPIGSNNLISLCIDSFDDVEENTAHFTLDKRKEYRFSTLKIIEVITDKRKVDKLESQTEYPKYKKFFISRYVDKTNTNIFALFQRKGSKCIVYSLSGYDEISGVSFENKRLTFRDGFHFGSREHYEAQEYFNLVNIDALTSVSIGVWNIDENWTQDNVETKEECKCEFTLLKDRLIVKKTQTDDYMDTAVSNCIEGGEYLITKEKLIKIK